MEKHINLYDKEHMKLAMLKHEEVFREQVFELHRLYQIQKMLMQNQEQPRWNLKKCKDKIQGRDLERPAEEESGYNMGYDSHEIGKIVDESELLELTLGPSNHFYPRKKIVDAPLSLLQSDNHSETSLSASSSSNNNRQHQHQQKMNTSRQENNSQKWRVDDKKSYHLGEMRNEVNNVVGEENLIQDRSLNNNPPWLLQALSLKMT